MSPSRRPRDTSDLFPIQVMTSIEFKSILEHKSLPKKSKVEKKTSAAAKRAAAAAAAASTTNKEADSKADSPKQKARGRAPTKDKLAKEKKGPYNGYGWIWQDDFIEYLQRDREIMQYIRQLILNSPFWGCGAVPEYYSGDQSCWFEQLCGYLYLYGYRYGYETEGLVPMETVPVPMKMEVEMGMKMEVEMGMKMEVEMEMEPVEYVHGVGVVYMNGVYAPLACALVPPEYQVEEVWWDGGCGYGEVYEDMSCEGVL